jgi:hypothetical protein
MDTQCVMLALHLNGQQGLRPVGKSARTGVARRDGVSPRRHSGNSAPRRPRCVNRTPQASCRRGGRGHRPDSAYGANQAAYLPIRCGGGRSCLDTSMGRRHVSQLGIARANRSRRRAREGHLLFGGLTHFGVLLNQRQRLGLAHHRRNRKRLTAANIRPPPANGGFRTPARPSGRSHARAGWGQLRHACPDTQRLRTAIQVVGGLLGRYGRPAFQLKWRELVGVCRCAGAGITFKVMSVLQGSAVVHCHGLPPM